MRVYCTSRNTGPSWSSDPVHMVYLGTSVKEAEEAVGDFSKYQKEEFPNTQTMKSYCALPRHIEFEMIQFYMADGWWYSIVMFELNEGENNG